MTETADPITTTATATAHPNIALIKYWGKRDSSLNLPATDSISLTLGPLSTTTTLEWTEHPQDNIELDGRALSGRDASRISRFLDLVRARLPRLKGARVASANSFPTAAGLASSSSGFAALALAATASAGLTTTEQELSVLARQGSGSAARSLFGGFVHMHAGRQEDGSDAFATRVAPETHWPLRVRVALTTAGRKDIPSTDGMNLTTRTSPYYPAWIDDVAESIPEALRAISNRDFEALADISESSALRMHASAIAAQPGVLYWNGTTVECIHAVRSLRKSGVPAFFTIDAGPHVKVFTTADHADKVESMLKQIAGVHGVLKAEPARDASVNATGSLR